MSVVAVGKAVGLGEGFEVSVREGDRVEGLAVGNLVEGTTVGLTVGTLVGAAEVGILLGDLEGVVVDLTGRDIGFDVGFFVGVVVGFTDGEDEGL